MTPFAPNLDDEAVFQLLRQGEGHLVDFKRAHLSTSMPEEARDRKRGEWMKDILAFANTRRTQPAYVLVGITDDRRIVGITESRDDASFQVLFQHKTNRLPLFRYYDITMASDDRLGVFEVPAEQPRPIYLRQSFGPVAECVVYVRRGSTNAPLEPDQWHELQSVSQGDTDWQSATGRDDVRELATRWLDLFEAHGVRHHQIPTLLPSHYLPLAALADWRQMAAILSNRLIDDTCRLFNVRREWLDGDSALPYSVLPLSIDVRAFLDVLEEWMPMCEEVAVLGFRDGRQPLEESPRQRCGFMLRGTIRDFGDKPIFKYQPLYSEFDWSYDKGRLTAKVAWLAARLAGCSSWGWRLDREQIAALCSGRTLPDRLLTYSWAKDWYPEDFTFPAEGSAVAKEAEEYAWVERVAREHGVFDRAAALAQEV